MGRINTRKVLVGGVVAAVVLFIGEFVGNALLDFDAAMEAAGLAMEPRTMTMVVPALVLIFGVTMIWIYAAIRPRYGPGPTTALRAGFAAWVLGYAIAFIVFTAMGILETGPAVAGLVLSLVYVALAALLGARFYREEDAVVQGPAAQQAEAEPGAGGRAYGDDSDPFEASPSRAPEDERPSG